MLNDRSTYILLTYETFPENSIYYPTLSDIPNYSHWGHLIVYCEPQSRKHSV